MRIRTNKKLPNVWPPLLTWDEPRAYDANGVIHEATEDWLLATWGPPIPGPTPPRPREGISDAELDELLASAGFERAPDLANA